MECNIKRVVKFDMKLNEIEEIEMIYTREDIKNVLQNQSAVVTFTKKDGTERKMKCTLSEDLIPLDHRPTNDGTPRIKLNDTVLPVFDLDNQGWRSFAISSIKDVQI